MVERIIWSEYSDYKAVQLISYSISWQDAMRKNLDFMPVYQAFLCDGLWVLLSCWPTPTVCDDYKESSNVYTGRVINPMCNCIPDVDYHDINTTNVACVYLPGNQGKTLED